MIVIRAPQAPASPWKWAGAHKGSWVLEYYSL